MLKPDELADALLESSRQVRRISGRARKLGVGPDDLLQSALLAAIIARRTYDPALGTWLTHIQTPIRFAILRELRRSASPAPAGRDRNGPSPIELTEANAPTSTALQEMAIECRGWMERAEAMIGEDGAGAVAAVLSGAMSRGDAAELLGLSAADFATVLGVAVRPMRRRHDE